MIQRLVIFVSLFVASWVVMILTHEGGHVIGGLASGATLKDFNIVPWRLPYSLHSPDPYPLVTLWAGPLLGIAIPMAFAVLIRRRWAWFISDFCLLANGGYLALAWISGDRFLDTPRLLEAGANSVTILVYCSVTTAIGYVRFRADCRHYLLRP